MTCRLRDFFASSATTKIGSPVGRSPYGDTLRLSSANVSRSPGSMVPSANAPAGVAATADVYVPAGAPAGHVRLTKFVVRLRVPAGIVTLRARAGKRLWGRGCAGDDERCRQAREKRERIAPRTTQAGSSGCWNDDDQVQIDGGIRCRVRLADADLNEVARLRRLSVQTLGSPGSRTRPWGDSRRRQHRERLYPRGSVPHGGSGGGVTTSAKPGPKSGSGYAKHGLTTMKSVLKMPGGRVINARSGRNVDAV